ncbi:hypothetical protein C0992_009332 [Termitomyces sp. T32_za158]|nr:hypothetical protein C0992_009332 [Termitomyces sp. T32_za158]
MDIHDLHPPDDYSHRFFIWHEWIQANGPLTAENVFDYFATSMFYDKQSNNQVLRMQTIHSGLPVVNEAEELKPMAAYFIINNRIYQSPDVYTVLSNRLVRALSLAIRGEAKTRKQLTALHSLQTSLDILRSHRPDYTPRTGFVWPITDPSLTAENTKKRGQDDDTITVDESASAISSLKQKVLSSQGEPKRQQNNMLLLNAMRATAAHSQMALASSTFAASVEAVPAETPAAHARSSATPGPSSQIATPKVAQSVSIQQEPVKAPPGGGKKKRKRAWLLASVRGNGLIVCAGTGTSLPASTAPG